VVYGIRPEHIDLTGSEGLPATVAVVEPTGSETQVFLRLGESEIVAVFRERHQFEPGQTVHLKPRPEHAHLFDGASGARV
jgi:multiple sugar transport system ATP-binding protein